MRIFFSLFIALLMSNLSSAQLRIGLKMSPQMTWATSDNKSTTSNGSRINVAYGLMLDYYFTENYALSSEFCVNTYGANLNLKKEKYSTVDYGGVTYSNADDVKYDYKLQYFQIPLLLKMRTKELNSMRYYAEFGFGMGFLFKSKADVKFGTQSLSNVNINEPDVEDKYYVYDNSTSHVQYDDHVSGFRGSLIVGAGVHYSLKSNAAVVMGIRYDNGLTSFTSNDKWKTTLNYIALNMGLLF